MPYRKFLMETEHLKQVLATTGGAPSYEWLEIEKEAFAAEMCVVRLHDAWARFCRELVVTSAYAEPTTASGTKIPRVQGIRRRSQVIPKLLSTYKRRTQEPSWYLARDCIDASSRLQVANHIAISSGIGLSFPTLSVSPNDQLRMVRNFFAHKNWDTAREVRQVARSLDVPNNDNPSTLPTTLIPPGITVFAFWVNCLRSMAYLSVQ